ncbi:hypothetical protein [Stenotrophomonas sp. Ps181]|uniref:hypothetical protein n=1 Tax=Stenotrophomonas sp. Ps181 TaxID=2859892 RepID=UPI0021E1026C|nr:hypothetical protein [Stenotrophomonas sp. Ps181]MCV0220218.1 hypothetical protein [Stenotrophomonas sp. Ps181]
MAVSNFSPVVRRGLKWVLWALALSIVIVGIAYCLIWWMSPSASIVTWGRFAVFIDSLLAGVVAFALLGAFTFLASLRKPDEDAVSERIAYLYSARLDDSQATKAYLTDQLMTLGATIRGAESLYNFLEVASDGKSVRVNVRISMTIVNMMKRDVYEQKMPIGIGFDPVAGHEGNMGAVIRIETTACDGEGRYQRKVEHLKSPQQLTAEKKRYQSEVLLSIPPHGELYYEYEYEGWVKNEDNFWTGVNRFAETLSVRVANLTERKLTVRPNPEPKRPVHTNIDRVEELEPTAALEIFLAREVKPSTPITFSIQI